MNRFAFFITQSISLVGAVVLTLTLAGCGTLPQPLSADAQSGLVPAGRGAL
jgi:starvation-inducible outer membrane lipoprotein